MEHNIEEKDVGSRCTIAIDLCSHGEFDVFEVTV